MIDPSKIINLNQTASLLKRADLLISIDTGIAHLGAQTETPLIVLFSSHHPRGCSPLSNKKIDIFHSEVCNSCKRYACPEKNPLCIRAIKVKEIMNATDKLLAKNHNI